MHSLLQPYLILYTLTTTYSEIIKSRRVIEQVIDNLSLDYSYAELTKNVSVSSVNDTEIIKVAVNNPDRGVAADITNEIVKVFSAEIVVIYEGKVSNVSTIDKATEAKAPYNVNIAKDFLIKNINELPIKKLIIEEIEKYQDGIIDDKTFELTKTSKINDVLKNSDSPFNPLFDLQEELMGFGKISDDIIIENINNLTKDDIKEVANMLVLDTIYILKGRA